MQSWVPVSIPLERLLPSVVNGVKMKNISAKKEIRGWLTVEVDALHTPHKTSKLPQKQTLRPIRK